MEQEALTGDECLQAILAQQVRTNALLQQLLQAVEAVELGDSEIGRAAQRYADRMAVVRGGL